MDSIRISNPKEWQALCKRVVHAFNPNLEYISSATQLREKMMEGMRTTDNWRALGFLEGGGPELLFKEARKEKTWAQKLVGWIKPWRKRPIIVKPALKKWSVTAYRQLILSHEWAIIKARQALRELGVKLKPYSNLRIRKMEERYLREIGWKAG